MTREEIKQKVTAFANLCEYRDETGGDKYLPDSVYLPVDKLIDLIAETVQKGEAVEDFKKIGQQIKSLEDTLMDGFEVDCEDFTGYHTKGGINEDSVHIPINNIKQIVDKHLYNREPSKLANKEKY